MEARISTRGQPGRPACGRRDPDTFRYVVLASFARRLVAPGRPQQAPGEPGAAAPGGLVTRGGLLAGLVTRGGLLAGLRDGSAIAPIDVPPAVDVIRFVTLVAVVCTVPVFTPGFGHGARGTGTAVALAISAAAWLVWQFAGQHPRLWLAMLVVMAAAGGTLAGMSALSTAVAVGCVVAVAAGARLPIAASFAVVAETVAAFIIASVVGGAAPEAVAGWSAGFIGFWAFGLTRHAYLLRAVEAEDALEQARRVHAAETQAAALAERARIAREIHDVLAHSLAAVSVNLQAAGGLLEALEQGPEVAKAIECVNRASALTREGMTETRRAILALREDEDAGPPAGYQAPGSQAPGYQAPGYQAESGHAAGEAPGARAGSDAGTERLTGRLRALAGQHAAPGEPAVAFTVTGTPRPLGADGALTAYRTAQEGLTNARKHAPGQPVSLSARYQPGEMTLEVENPLPPPGTAGPLAHAGTGYGLAGLRERAALAGGTLTAGAEAGRWRVRLRLPG